MDNEFKWIESIERGTASLTGIINASRWMEAEIAKRKRTQRIALAVLAVVFGAVALYVVFRLLDPRSSQVDRDFAVILGGALLAMVVLFGAIIIFGIRSSTSKPYARYKAALAKSYPGLDTSSEDAIKNYVWNYASEPEKLLPNLFKLLEREGEQDKIHGETGDIYTPAKHVFLNVWTTNNIYGELYGLHTLHEGELELLDYAIADFKVIGADTEAQAWSEVGTLFSELEPFSTARDALDNGEDLDTFDFDGQFDDPYAFTEVQTERLHELEERLTECRPETEAKLADYVLQHKAEFVFGTGQSGGR
ncbi:MAG: hypothetical protein IJ125_00890 [Atopobiaceae bacterium]|nr:hypothetical protein [Atopobiaceae bacterium]